MIISHIYTSVGVLFYGVSSCKQPADPNSDNKIEAETIIVPDVTEIKEVTVPGGSYIEDPLDTFTGVFIEGRTVNLSPFYIGKYEVTQEEYASVMKDQKVTVNGTEYLLESNPSSCTSDSKTYTLFEGEEQGKRPVDSVTWYDAVWYCNALSIKEGVDPAYTIKVTSVEKRKTGYSIKEATVDLIKDSKGYRLPTEAEWEFAARGGDPNAEDWNYLFSGSKEEFNEKTAPKDRSRDTGLDLVAWYAYNNKSGTTQQSKETDTVDGRGSHQVGLKKTNKLGLYDMSGNVAEWCYDYKGDIVIVEDGETDPIGASTGTERIYRGGNWQRQSCDVIVTKRLSDKPGARDVTIGFRVARSIK